MIHEGLDDLTKEQVDAMQDGMGNLIANNRDGGAREGKKQTPKLATVESNRPSSHEYTADAPLVKRWS